MLKENKKILTALLLTTALFSCSTKTSKNNQENSNINDTTLSSDNKSTKDCIITMTSVGGFTEFYKEIIDEFNKENNGYKIECKNYDEFYNKCKDNDGGATPELFAEVNNQIFLDIIKGESIDIIMDNVFSDKGKFDVLAKKGAFSDLYPFLDSDTEIKREDFFENILKMSEVNGKLVTIPQRFSINTLYGETKYVGEKENWTLDEMIEHWEAMPEDATFNGNLTRDSVYRTILEFNANSFVDIQKCVSNFDSPEFLKELRFINSFSPPEEYKTEPDCSNPMFISELNLSSFAVYHDLFFDIYRQPIECTFVGYPSDDGSGAYISPMDRFGISANSSPEKQKGAWLFIKKMLEYDYQYKNGRFCFPINYKAFENIGKDEYSKSGEEYTYTAQGIEYTGTYLNYEEYCRLLEYIKTIKKMDIDLDYEITSIIDDEILSMMWDEKSPEETASAIQGRVEILVSEKY